MARSRGESMRRAGVEVFLGFGGEMAGERERELFCFIFEFILEMRLLNRGFGGVSSGDRLFIRD